MILSIYIAKVFGVMLVVTGLALLLNAKWYQKMLTKFLKSPPTIYLAGFSVMIIGLTLTMAHFVLEGWPLVITVFAWLIFLKGVLYLLIPDSMIKFSKQFNTENTLKIGGVISILVGLFFLYASYVSVF